ncbi:MAG: hypothetical protein E7I48_04025 [Clostridium celatum]|nr:hypothetical protein [Clostridium celatum]
MKLYSMIIDKKIIRVTNEYDLEMELPILNAFGINHAQFISGAMTWISDDNMVINDGKIKLAVGDIELTNLSNEDNNCIINSKSTLNIFYTGIKDYAFLFPRINNHKNKLAERLGRYYYESEYAYDNELWLSFVLMCGAIFEGLIYHELNYPQDNGLNIMTIQAVKNGIITEEESIIINSARKARNLIHANRFDQKYYSRKDAVDMKNLLDKLIYRFSMDY